MMMCKKCGAELLFYKVQGCWSCPTLTCSNHGVAFDKSGRAK
jgi:hypothetical protein